MFSFLIKRALHDFHTVHANVHAIKVVASENLRLQVVLNEKNTSIYNIALNRICNSLLNMSCCKFFNVTHFILKHSIDFINYSKYNASNFAIFLEYYKRFDQMNIMRNEGSIYLTENFKGIHFLLLFQFLYTSTCMAFSHKTTVCQNVILQCIVTT